jgi:hypothetical protein
LFDVRDVVGHWLVRDDMRKVVLDVMKWTPPSLEDTPDLEHKF